MPFRSGRAPAGVLCALLVALALAGCGSDADERSDRAVRTVAADDSPAKGPRSTPSTVLEAVPRAPHAAELGPRERALRPDVLVAAPRSLPGDVLERLAGLARPGGSTAFRAGQVRLDGRAVRAVAVDPSSFRVFAARQTAESDAVWQAVSRGQAVASHALAASRRLRLGGDVALAPAAGGRAERHRLGALATTGLPGSDLVVDDETGKALGLPAASGLLLVAPDGVDPVTLAASARAAAGSAARVDLLSAPASGPTAFLSGGDAARAFGAFSYRYHADGTIEPDAAWVRANIRTETVPVLGRVTCHRLMLPQLRGALQEVVDRGLASTLRTYDGCYVPRFIERNPERSISLHTWGIAIDMDAATNYRGIRGTMHPQVVAIFKRWGFRWGGDWSYTDPMHFELGAILPSPGR